MSKKKRIIIVIALVIVAIVIVSVIIMKGRGQKTTSNDGVYGQRVSDVMLTSDSSVEKYTGVVEAAESMDIKADPEKTVKEIHVSEGDTVTVGTPLFTYDIEDMNAKKECAQLELESLNNTLSGYVSQISQLTNEKKAASKEQQLDYTLQIQQLQTQQKQTEYEITSKNAEIQKYDESINNATVTATMDGMIKKINDTETASQETTAFMTIISTGNYRIKGTVDEQSLYYGGIEEGVAVIVRSRTDEEKTWIGQISKVDTDNPQQNNTGYYDMESSSEGASMYSFYVELASTEEMLLGQHIFIEPDYGQSEQKEGIWIDESFISESEEGSFVWVLNKKDRLEKRNVELGEYDEELMMYQVKSGITEDDYIVWASEDLHEGECALKWEEYIESDAMSDEDVYLGETEVQ